MKIKIWTAITDGGDGEHHFHINKSREGLLEEVDLTEENIESEGFGFDEYDYPVTFGFQILDIEGYEIVE